MGLSAKEFGLFSLLCLLMISFAGNAFLYETVQESNVQLGDLNAKLEDSKGKNQFLSKQVETLEQEKAAAQLAADRLTKVQAERKRQTAKTVTVIKEVLKHEPCADVLIPDSDKWVYYH